MAAPCTFGLNIELTDINNDVEKETIVEYTRIQLRKYICASKEHVLMPDDWSFKPFFQMRRRFKHCGWQYSIEYDADLSETMSIIDISILSIWEEIKNVCNELKKEGDNECLVFGVDIKYQTDRFGKILTVSVNVCLFWTSNKNR